MLGKVFTLLPLGLLLLEVYATAARAGDAADGGAVEAQEGFAALRAFEVFLNHVHSPFVKKSFQCPPTFHQPPHQCHRMH